jgi:hypothetical protein
MTHGMAWLLEREGVSSLLGRQLSWSHVLLLQKPLLNRLVWGALDTMNPSLEAAVLEPKEPLDQLPWVAA